MMAIALWAAGCAESQDAHDTPGNDVEIVAVHAPTPILQGTTIVVEARGMDPEAQLRTLRIAQTGSGAMTVLEEEPAAGEPTTATFRMTADALQALGVGSHELSFVLAEGKRASAPLVGSYTLAAELAVTLGEGIIGSYFRNDEPVLSGAGFVTGGEGRVELEFVGEFTPWEGSPTAVYSRLPLELAESLDRTRGTVRLTTVLGGIRPGALSGTVVAVSTLADGGSSRSGERPVEIEFMPPALFDYTPLAPFLGQIVEVRGGGFLGVLAGQSGDETTVLLFEGELVLEDGTRTPFGPKEAVTLFRGGGAVGFGLDIKVEEVPGGRPDRRLISDFFGIGRGVFEGVVTPIVIKGIDDQRGDPTPVQVTLAGVEQVVVVRFLPGFYDSLHHFGLSSAARQVIDVAFERMRTIYADYNVRFVENVPDDYLPGSVATLEVGGPDANGLGLFGYDNTHGKDMGNVRLFDSIGGANAQTQADNFPGFGGVFIESFLYWSSHPEIDAPLAGSPDVDPLFDEIFDPVRNKAATLEEATNQSTGGRTPSVQRAIGALGSIIGETSAHEVGHSLGLAMPYDADVFHNLGDGDGCLMDAGANRPFGERARQAGFSETRFCDPSPGYLEAILPRP